MPVEIAFFFCFWMQPWCCAIFVNVFLSMIRRDKISELWQRKLYIIGNITHFKAWQTKKLVAR